MKSLSKFKKAVNSIENKEPNLYPWTEQIKDEKMSEKKLKSRARSQNTSQLNVAYNINKKKKDKNTEKLDLNSDTSSKLTLTSRTNMFTNLNLSSRDEKDSFKINSIRSSLGKNNSNQELKSNIK